MGRPTGPIGLTRAFVSWAGLGWAGPFWTRVGPLEGLGDDENNGRLRCEEKKRIDAIVEI